MYPTIFKYINFFKELILGFDNIYSLTDFWPYYFFPFCLLYSSFSNFWINICLISYCISLLGLLYWSIANWVAQTTEIYLFSQFSRLEVQHQGISRIGSFWESWRKDLFQASLSGWRWTTSPLCLYVTFPLSMPMSKFPLLIKTPIILD